MLDRLLVIYNTLSQEVFYPPVFTLKDNKNHEEELIQPEQL